MCTMEEKHKRIFSRRPKESQTIQSYLSDPAVAWGIEKACLSTYLIYLYTNIYVMPAAFSILSQSLKRRKMRDDGVCENFKR